ncbi:MAG: glycosyltransferase family 39 protein, partial [Rhodospirillales bacterium]|nr:glycosyltransferase family 39 protein [Rhodospirillales bacterium]
RVLGLAIAAALIEAFPTSPEGDLARRFNQLVKRETCAAMGRSIELGRHLILSDSEASSGGRDKDTIIADAIEALLGAALCLVHAVQGTSRRSALLWWLGSGLCIGLALFSKYSAGLTLMGACVYLATQQEHRRWLARPEPYLAGLIATLIFSPRADLERGAWLGVLRLPGRPRRGRRVRAGDAARNPGRRGVVPAAVDLAAADGRLRPGGLARATGMARVAARLPRGAAHLGVHPGLRLVEPSRALPLGGTRLPDAVPAARRARRARPGARLARDPHLAGRHRHLRAGWGDGDGAPGRLRPAARLLVLFRPRQGPVAGSGGLDGPTQGADLARADGTARSRGRGRRLARHREDRLRARRQRDRHLPQHRRPPIRPQSIGRHGPGQERAHRRR